VREQIELLANIQQKDNTLKQLREQIFQVPLRIEEKENRVRELAEYLEADKNRIEETQKLQRQYEAEVDDGSERIKKSNQYEAEVDDGSERIKKSNGRLLSIKNNKEYQAVLKEIEEIKNENAQREDKILAFMEEQERLKQALNEQANELTNMRETFETEKTAIQAELKEAEKRLWKEEAQRREMAKAVGTDVLRTYEHLKTRIGSPVVVLAEKTTCTGCNLNIPPQMYNELQKRDSLRFCPNCNRIIYWEDGNGISG